jgi:hypothetical protein
MMEGGPSSHRGAMVANAIYATPADVQYSIPEITF